MTLGNLLEIYVNGALNISYNKDDVVATLGGVAITDDQARMLCSKFGWTEIYLSPFEIISKTAKFIKSFKTNATNLDALNGVLVEFQNKRSNTHGKTFDRIHVENRSKYLNHSILYNMDGNGSPYVIYDSFTSVPVKKCRNMKQVVEFINSKL